MISRAQPRTFRPLVFPVTPAFRLPSGLTNNLPDGRARSVSPGQQKINMKKALAALIVGAVLSLAISEVRAADKITGTWSWVQQGRRGGAEPAADAPVRKNTLKLKADGEKLTGTLAAPAGGRGGGAGGAAPASVEISDGKVKGDEISFSVKREVNGNAFVMKYTGKVDGDKITGKIEAPGRNGGEPTSRDWTATREAAEKAPEKK